MGTPTVMLGVELARKDNHKGVRRQFAFRHADESLSVCFDALPSPGLNLAAVAASGAPEVAEGDVALF